MTRALSRRDDPGYEDGMASLVPIAHVTLHERVYEELRTAIMDGVFASGETLTIRGVAQQLGTSAMPAREALARLATEGAVEVLPNRSIRIPDLDPDRVEEVCRLRGNLEGEAVSLAARRATLPELAAIRALHRTFVSAVKAGSAPRLIHSGQRFHFAMYRAARSPTLLSMVGMLWLQSGPWIAGPVRTSFNKGEMRAYADTVAIHHQNMLDALEARDPERAAAAVRAEIDGSERHLRETALRLIGAEPVGGAA